MITDEWMLEALNEAERAMSQGEIPVAAILVSGGKELRRHQTSVSRMGTLAAHAEALCLINAKNELWSPKRPVQIYTTLEPCLMCFGAGLQVGVDEIIYAMKASPDGVLANYPSLVASESIGMRGGVYEDRSVGLMRELLSMNPDHPSAEYVQAMLSTYSE